MGNQTYTKTPVLIVRTIEVDGKPDYGYSEFDDPELLSWASEGFCPFRLHDHADHGRFKVERQSDGTVICNGPPHPRKMEWEWTEE